MRTRPSVKRPFPWPGNEIPKGSLKALGRLQNKPFPVSSNESPNTNMAEAFQVIEPPSFPPPPPPSTCWGWRWVMVQIKTVKMRVLTCWGAQHHINCGALIFFFCSSLFCLLAKVLFLLQPSLFCTSLTLPLLSYMNEGKNEKHCALRVKILYVVINII